MIVSIYINIDNAWAYNFIGGLEEDRILDRDQVYGTYRLVTDYLKLQHNFLLTSNAVVYNSGLADINEALTSYDISPHYCMHYFRILYDALKTSLSSIGRSAIRIKPTCTDHELSGIIVEIDDGVY